MQGEKVIFQSGLTVENKGLILPSTHPPSVTHSPLRVCACACPDRTRNGLAAAVCVHTEAALRPAHLGAGHQRQPNRAGARCRGAQPHNQPPTHHPLHRTNLRGTQRHLLERRSVSFSQAAPCSGPFENIMLHWCITCSPQPLPSCVLDAF